MTELKRCPFCGGEAKVLHRWLSMKQDLFRIICKKCKIRTMKQTKTDAIAAWNKREAKSNDI